MNIKKILLLGAATILMSIKMTSQCQTTATANYSSLNTCLGSNIILSGTATLKKMDSEGQYVPCGGTVSVRLQKLISGVWTNTGTPVSTSGFYNITIPSSYGSGAYRALVTNPSGNCSCTNTSSYGTPGTTLSFNSNQHDNSYSFNGVATFNTGCYNFNFCQGQAISMNNIIMTNPSAITNVNKWRISTANDQYFVTPTWSSWTNGIPPSSYDLLNLLQTNYGTSVPAGNYGIQLQTYNGCTTVTHFACLTIMSAPSFSVAQKIDATNSNIIPSTTSCSLPYSNLCPGSFGYILTAANTSMPSNQVTSGQWSCSLEETTYIKGCVNTPTLVFNKPYTTISNMSNLNNIDLNVYATTYGGKPANYIYNTNKKWKFTLNIKYNCNNVYTYTCWLYYNSTGCRIVKSNMMEESTETISDNAVILFPNPTNSNVEIKTDETITSITVYDINGKETKIESVNNNIDLSTFKSGIYTLKIFTENGIISKKVIKQD